MDSFPGPGNFKKLVANFDGSISSILVSWSPLFSIHYTIEIFTKNTSNPS